MEDPFDAGYQKHLAWHRAHQDPLVWYGWTVTHGPRMGMFIDGTFGAPFAAFDQRVAPADDAKDAERSFLLHGQPTFREAGACAATSARARRWNSGSRRRWWKCTCTR
jgi:hypothetical protein